MADPVLRPKDAATLLVIRRDGPVPRVLMGRRVRGHAFMPDKWVFPGGRIHPADYRVAAATELHPDAAAALARTCPVPRARALALTAIRETFEETGLIIGAAGAGSTRSPEWRAFLDTGHLPHLEPLQFVGRAITPPARTRRFDARFFSVDARHLASLDPGAGSGSSTRSPGSIGRQPQRSTCRRSPAPFCTKWRCAILIRRGRSRFTASIAVGIACWRFETRLKKPPCHKDRAACFGRR